MEVKTKIENIFCLIDFKQNLDIRDQRAKEAGFEYGKNPSSYIYTHPKLQTKMMIFPSGKVFLNGAKNQDEIASSFWSLIRKLKEVGIRITLGSHTDIEIQNVLASANIHDYIPNIEVNLEKISLKENASYESEKFPAVFLDFFIHGISGVAIVFKSGKILIGDVKTPEDANLILERIIGTIR